MEDSFDNDDEEEQGGGEECYFTTPEHPTGVELVLNLLSTWGDKFYIGLTGIEVYTSTGIPASIAQVCTSTYCIAKNFHLEKIFAIFVTPAFIG